MLAFVDSAFVKDFSDVNLIAEDLVDSALVNGVAFMMLPSAGDPAFGRITADVLFEPVRASLPSRERKDWFIPANDAMRAFQKSIDSELKARGYHVPMPERGVGLQGEFSASTRPEKSTTYETVREKVKQEAQRRREEIPPQYKQKPYAEDVPKESRMSGAFNRASAGNGDPEIPRKEPPQDKYDL